MSNIILATCGLLNSTEAALPNALELATQRVSAQSNLVTQLQTQVTNLTTERDALKTEKAQVEASAKATNEKRAKTLVEAAVADGRIKPKDDETKNDFIERITAGDAFAEKMLAQMPKENGDITTPLVTAGADKQGGDGEHAFLKEARKMVEAKRAANEDEAFTIVASENPKLYEDYNKRFETVA